MLLHSQTDGQWPPLHKEIYANTVGARIAHPQRKECYIHIKTDSRGRLSLQLSVILEGVKRPIESRRVTNITSTSKGNSLRLVPRHLPGDAGFPETSVRVLGVRAEGGFHCAIL